jgi:DNA polymerase III alpha subunit
LFDGVRLDCNQPDWSLDERCTAQEQVLGIAVDAHPLELASERIAQVKSLSTVEAAGRVGERVRVVGLRMASHRSRTAGGETMLFLTLEDLDGLLDVVIFPDVYRRFRNTLSASTPFLLSGIIQMDAERGEPVMRVERVDRI